MKSNVCLRNHLAISGLLDRSRCGAVLILIAKEILWRDLATEASSRDLVRGAFVATFYGDLAKRVLLQKSCQESSHTQRLILPRDLLQGDSTEIFARETCQTEPGSLW